LIHSRVERISTRKKRKRKKRKRRRRKHMIISEQKVGDQTG